MYIKITDVNKTIKKAPILRDINLEFTGGKVYGCLLYTSDAADEL